MSHILKARSLYLQFPSKFDSILRSCLSGPTKRRNFPLSNGSEHFTVAVEIAGFVSHLQNSVVQFFAPLLSSQCNSAFGAQAWRFWFSVSPPQASQTQHCFCLVNRILPLTAIPSQDCGLFYRRRIV